METRVWMDSLLSFSFRSALNRKENKLLLLPLKCRRLPNGFLLYNQWTKLGCGVLAVLLVRVCVFVCSQESFPSTVVVTACAG